MQAIANEALENGLREYEKRHSESRGKIQGSIVILRNADAGILAEAGGRQVYEDHVSTFADYNRAASSRRQPGSAMKPIVYLAAFEQGATLEHGVLDEPITVPAGMAS